MISYSGRYMSRLGSTTSEVTSLEASGKRARPAEGSSSGHAEIDPDDGCGVRRPRPLVASASLAPAIAGPIPAAMPREGADSVAPDGVAHRSAAMAATRPRELPPSRLPLSERRVSWAPTALFLSLSPSNSRLTPSDDRAGDDCVASRSSAVMPAFSSACATFPGDALRRSTAADG